jgi:type III pantothenate kinase
MKILAVDAGNTRIKWGVRDGERWTQQGAFESVEAHRLSEDLAPLICADRIIVANVAGDAVREALSAALAGATNAHWVVGRPEQCGVRSGYADPAQLGPDRWAALIGARHLYPGSCVVVNAGTTMTVDALSAESIFLGGFIVAGYDLMRRALDANTGRLRLAEGAFSFFPDKTADAIASGAINALAGAVDRMCRYMVATGEDDPIVILSGGNAPLLGPHLSAEPQLVDNLVLEGLAVIGTRDV